MSTLAAAVEGLALLGPGLPDWAGARAALAGEQPYVHAATLVPAPALLPPNERRRSGLAVKIALAVGAAALDGYDPTGLHSVFASSSADGDTCHAICEQLAGADRLISPTRFHNSVHNAPSGYWSIATRCMAPSISLCGFDASFGAGLLEALAFVCAHGKPVLLIAYDAPYPEPLLARRPVRDPFGVALLLAPQPRARALARITAALADSAPDALGESALEALRRAVPTARSLPLLRLLARGEPGAAVLEYLDRPNIAVQVTPCA